LDEVARFLGGNEWVDGKLAPRPVTIVDAGLRKDMDLRVISPIEAPSPQPLSPAAGERGRGEGALPDKSIWPSIYRLLGNEIRRHRSTIVFANNRRSVERITAFLNAEEETGNEKENSSPLL